MILCYCVGNPISHEINMKTILKTSLILMLAFLVTEGTAAPIASPAAPVITSEPPKATATKPIPPAPLQTPTETTTETKTPEARLWNLQDADILGVINEVSLETGKNFIVDPRVNGKITLVSSKPIKPDAVYDIFLSVLALLGYSAIPSGDVVKIVPNMESSEYATRVASKHSPGKGDEVVVRIIPLENVSANQLIPVVRPLLPQWSNISAYVPGNTIVLVGRASNLERIVSVINSIDKSSDNNIEIVPLHQASAAQMANVLNNLQNSARASGDTTQVSIAPDERSNSILISGNKATRLRIRMLISQLDTPSTGAQGNTEVIYLRYLIAKNFAPILGKIANNLLGKDGGKDSAPSSTSSASAATTGGTTAYTATATKAKEPENLTNIQAEPSTNSIIITAPPAMMRALNSVIAKLDIRPAQVLVEGIIVEIDQADLKNLGIQWGALVTSTTTQPPANSGFSQFGEGVIGIIPSMQVQAILNMLQNNTNVNVLSTPSVVVLDNHKATLDIGQDVPTENGSYATSSNVATPTPFNTISYKKVALSLEVIPQINLGNSVRLSVKLKNDTLQNPENPGLTPLINTSQISNSVIVKSCDTLVLGGLIRNTISEHVDRIPILSDIPGVGYLFKHKVRQLEKRNLVVFLKPVIMHTVEDASIISNTKYDQAREAQINWPVDLSNHPNEQKAENILPLWKNPTTLPKPFEG
jgi:general secretion pathway protein D